MKKALLITLTLALAHCAGAQKENSFKENTFLSFNGGFTLYKNESGMTTGFNASAGIGHWIVRPLALRLSYNGVLAPSYAFSNAGNDGLTLFHSVSGEIMWDPLATFERMNLLGEHFNIYPMVGFGFLFRGKGSNGEDPDRDLHVMLGLQVAWHQSRYHNLDVVFELKNFFLPTGFDQSAGYNGFLNTNLGISYYLDRSANRHRTPFESRRVSEDWFVGLGAGANFSSFEFEYMDPKYNMWGIASGIMLGRNLSKVWTMRLGLDGISAHERFDTTQKAPGKRYVFSNIHFDVMYNVTHALGFRHGSRFSLLPYVGGGLIWRHDNVIFDVAANLGLVGRYYLSRRSDLFFDLRYLAISPSTGGGMGASGYYYGVGIPSFTVGYIYNLGTSTTRYRMPLDWNP